MLNDPLDRILLGTVDALGDLTPDSLLFVFDALALPETFELADDVAASVSDDPLDSVVLMGDLTDSLLFTGFVPESLFFEQVDT